MAIPDANPKGIKLRHVVCKEMMQGPEKDFWIVCGFDTEEPELHYFNIYRWTPEIGLDPDVVYFKMGDPNVTLQSGYGETKPVMTRQHLHEALVDKGFERW